MADEFDSVMKFEGLGMKRFTTLEREWEMRIAVAILTMLALSVGPLYGGITEQPHQPRLKSSPRF